MELKWKKIKKKMDEQVFKMDENGAKMEDKLIKIR